MRNRFFSFSMTAMAVLTLSLAMTTALLAVSSLQMVAIYEKKVRLHYLADSAVREGWQEVQRNPLPYFQRHAVDVPQSAQLAEKGEAVTVEVQGDRGYLRALAVDEAASLEQTSSLFFEVVRHEDGQYELQPLHYRD
ncbi:hypothetical protein [Megasphaera sp. DISK 18]|uniref:hypothetical protein n=1 Tax=Megasphaera sp. DISK 18 TaxID=1776081 RepID=UPI000807D77C|nr:hypothetical protein [Megasphaera sp. DISK 18]OBZ33712.1 hypothetical protein A0U42_00870 [Megasphaera sp. DISK 18]